MNNIILALDGSEAATHSLPHAIRVAQREAATLVLVLVLPLRPGDSERERRASRSQAEGYLESLQRSLLRRGVDVRSIVDEGNGDVIRDMLDGSQAALIVAHSGSVHSAHKDLALLHESLLSDYPGSVVMTDTEL